MESITFQIGSDANHDEIIDFLNLHFLPEEPMNISIGLLEPGYRIPYFDRMVRDQLREEGSLVVLAREKNVLLGLAVFVTDNSNTHIDQGKEKETDLVCPRKLREIFQFIEMMRSHLDVASFLGVSQWADLEFLVCHSQLRRPGLGTELVRIGLNMLADSGTKESLDSILPLTPHSVNLQPPHRPSLPPSLPSPFGTH